MDPSMTYQGPDASDGACDMHAKLSTQCNQFSFHTLLRLSGPSMVPDGKIA